MSKFRGSFILTYDGQRASSIPLCESQKSLNNRKSSSNTIVSESPSQTKSPDNLNLTGVKRFTKTDLPITGSSLLQQHLQDSVKNSFKDGVDHSNHPSYSQLKAPYYRLCRERYKAVKKLYEQQFQAEIENIVAQQSTAFDAVCCVRVLSITSLWPPLHTHRQVDQTHKLFELSPKQKKRLAYIMRVDWSKT